MAYLKRQKLGSNLISTIPIANAEFSHRESGPEIIQREEPANEPAYYGAGRRVQSPIGQDKGVAALSLVLKNSTQLTHLRYVVQNSNIVYLEDIV